MNNRAGELVSEHAPTLAINKKKKEEVLNSLEELCIMGIIHIFIYIYILKLRCFSLHSSQHFRFLFCDTN